MTEKIVTFKDLITWKESHLLTIEIYKITKNFPKEELFGITNQIRRSSGSVGANIAEGFSRQSDKEKVQFYSIAMGSITETENHLILAKDLGFIDEKTFSVLNDRVILIHKLCNGLIKSIRAVF